MNILRVCSGTFLLIINRLLIASKFLLKFSSKQYKIEMLVSAAFKGTTIKELAFGSSFIFTRNKSGPITEL